MLNITNVKIYDLKETVIASGNAMRTSMAEYTDEEFERGIMRLKTLVQIAKKSKISCHDNALTGIRVSFDIKYPQYWSLEFQRYHFADIITSSSKMHRLCKMDIAKSCNKYVTEETIEQMKNFVNSYNCAVEAGEDEAVIYHNFMTMISNCPMGLELFMRVSTNYKQLQTIYRQRKNHRLKEDWGAFCKMIENLPYAQEFLL